MISPISYPRIRALHGSYYLPAGVIATQYVANIELAPTTVALTGVTPRRVLDGRSLPPLALNSRLGRSGQLMQRLPRMYLAHATSSNTAIHRHCRARHERRVRRAKEETHPGDLFRLCNPP